MIGNACVMYGTWITAIHQWKMCLQYDAMPLSLNGDSLWTRRFRTKLSENQMHKMASKCLLCWLFRLGLKDISIIWNIPNSHRNLFRVRTGSLSELTQDPLPISYKMVIVWWDSDWHHRLDVHRWSTSWLTCCKATIYASNDVIVGTASRPRITSSMPL